MVQKIGILNLLIQSMSKSPQKVSDVWVFDIHNVKCEIYVKRDLTSIIIPSCLILSHHTGQCLVRGKGGYRNSVTVQNCKKGEFLPLVYHPTEVHENGFYLKSAGE